MKNKLGRKLLLWAVISLLAGVFIFFLIQMGGYNIADSVINNSEYIDIENNKVCQSVQKYVKNNNISSKSLCDLDSYIRKNSNHYFAIYINDNNVYDSIGMFPDNINQVTDEESVYDIKLKDCNAKIYVYVDVASAYYNITDIIAMIFGIIVFIVIFVLLIHKKLQYIVLLEKELRILEGGDLEYNITVQGKDELGQLAKSIDDMRQSIVQRENDEKAAIESNKEMITALSHDVRTPLTSLLGYIELINNGTYKDEKQLKHFVLMSREKVLRLKEMTDRLFSYSLVNEEKKSDFIDIDAYEFIQQILNDNIFELENNGFCVDYIPSVFSGIIKIEPNNIARVFDNVISNIKRYADISSAVEIKCVTNQKTVSISFKNKISNKNETIAGTGIGINTCKSIMKNHNGKFTNNKDSEIFYSIICFKLETDDRN